MVKRCFESTGFQRNLKGFKKPTYVKSNAAFVKKVTRIVKRQAEVKYMQTVANNVATVPSGALFLINGISEGDDINNRTGRKITTSSLQLKFEYNPSITAVYANDLLMVALVIDTQCNAAACTITDIWDTATAGYALSMRQIATYPERFKVVKVKTYPVNLMVGNGAATTASYNTVCDDWYIDLSKLPKEWGVVQYGGTSNVIGSITKNAMYIAYGTAFDTTTAGAGKGFSYNVRYKFVDL